MHSSSDFNVAVAIFGDFGGEIVLLNKIFWDVAELEMHVLVVGHWGVNVEIFDVESYEFGSGGRNIAVEEYLGREEINDGCTTAMCVVDSIAAYSEMHPTGITFLWSVLHHNASICDISPLYDGDIDSVDEEYGVCSFDKTRHSLCQSS